MTSTPLEGLPFTTLGLLAALCLATVAHELGHLLVAARLRIPVRRITVGLGPILWRREAGALPELVWRLAPLGMAIGVPGRRDDDGTLRRPVEHDMLVAAAGPAASFLLPVALVGLAALLRAGPGLESWLIATALLSALLGLSNLLPLPGLDGGHLVVLGAARLGWVLSPRQEIQVHRVGLRLVVLATVVFLGARVAGIA